jgi:hypothetical protein
MFSAVVVIFIPDYLLGIWSDVVFTIPILDL